MELALGIAQVHRNESSLAVSCIQWIETVSYTKYFSLFSIYIIIGLRLLWTMFTINDCDTMGFSRTVLLLIQKESMPWP